MIISKICHFTSVHSIDDVRIFEKECTSLAANGFDVTLIACGDIAFTDEKNGVKRISLSVPVKNRLQRMIKRSNAVYKKALEINADIYHFHDPELLPIGLKLKKKGKKVIFDSHEFYGEQIREKQYFPKILRKIIARIYMKYESYVCKKIDAVIQVCTLNGKNYFRNRAKKSIFITNPPILQKNITNPIIFYKNRKAVSYIGTLSLNRGITNIVKASVKAKVKLILGGNFNSSIYYDELTMLDGYSNVDYKGYINRNQMVEIFNQCFAGLSTLLHIGQYDKIDTFPTKVYDYMSAGIPVIISNTSYAKKMINKYKFGICVDPYNIDEIASVISYLNKNRTQAKQMGDNGRKAFEKEFNWQIEEKKLILLYNSL